MSKRSLISICFVLLAFAAGVGLGMFMGSAPTPLSIPGVKDASTSSKFTELSATEANDSLLKSRIAELEKELSEPEKDPDELVQADRLALFKNNHIKVGDAGKVAVSPDMIDLLKLSPAEVKSIDEHLTEIQDETQELENAKMVMVNQTANSVTYEIPPYPEGEQFKQKLASLLSSDIGEDRAEVFMSSDADIFRSQYSSFGEQKTQIKIDGLGNFQTRQITESYYNADGTLDFFLSLPTDGIPLRWQKLLQFDTTPPKSP